MARSRITVASPNAPCASDRALRSASGNAAASATSRMPRPPPPATALIMTGKPIFFASASITASLWSAP